MLHPTDSLDLTSLRSRYQAGTLRPSDVVAGVLQRLAAAPADHVWIAVQAADQLQERAEALEALDMAHLPLYGVPFAVKDNIDAVPLPTTAACAAFAYLPAESAPVVQRLLDAGAMLIGKTNMDQFATGLVGTRSPYGAVPNAFNTAFIAGGSSSGSAVAVASGLVSFALGTDTAGSGRVPAAFNNIIGLKPTRGLLSTRGVVPACRSLDCVSILALSVPDAWDILEITRGFDVDDPFSRPPAATPAPPRPPLRRFTFGVPAEQHLTFCGNDAARRQFDTAVERLCGLGGTPVAVDLTPFVEAARLLYDGPWVAERYLAVRDVVAEHPDALHPVTHSILATSANFTAVDTFAAYHRLKELRRHTSRLWEDFDILVTPTAGTIFTIAEVEADPLRLNSQLGYYTNFVNLLDLCALAIPAGWLDSGLPFGITLVAPAFDEPLLCTIGDAAHRAANLPMGATQCGIPPQEEPSRRQRRRPATQQ